MTPQIFAQMAVRAVILAAFPVELSKDRVALAGSPDWIPASLPAVGIGGSAAGLRENQTVTVDVTVLHEEAFLAGDLLSRILGAIGRATCYTWNGETILITWKDTQDGPAAFQFGTHRVSAGATLTGAAVVG